MDKSIMVFVHKAPEPEQENYGVERETNSADLMQLSDSLSEHVIEEHVYYSGFSE